MDVLESAPRITPPLNVTAIILVPMLTCAPDADEPAMASWQASDLLEGTSASIILLLLQPSARKDPRFGRDRGSIS